MELLLIVVLLAGTGWFLFRQSEDKTQTARSAHRQWRKAVREQLELTHAVHDGYTLGVNVRRRAVAVIDPHGQGKWIPYEAVAGVELTPFYTRVEQGTSEATTRRGAQLIGAGIGAAIAGPAGMVVGGLSGGTRTESFSTSSEFLSGMELKLRLLSEEEPLLKLRFEGKAGFNPDTKEFEGGLDELERIAARLATEIDCREQSTSASLRADAFDTFEVPARPEVGEGWWSQTFG
jgi:hypothetical protein